MKRNLKHSDNLYITILLLVGVIVFLTVKYVQIREELYEASYELELREVEEV